MGWQERELAKRVEEQRVLQEEIDRYNALKKELVVLWKKLVGEVNKLPEEFKPTFSDNGNEIYGKYGYIALSAYGYSGANFYPPFISVVQHDLAYSIFSENKRFYVDYTIGKSIDSKRFTLYLDTETIINVSIKNICSSEWSFPKRRLFPWRLFS